jgi:6-pyruvoyltetrahydropterin/6-carboxytetrahydropterin synthase
MLKSCSRLAKPSQPLVVINAYPMSPPPATVPPLPAATTLPWPALAGPCPALAITKRLVTAWPSTCLPCHVSLTLQAPMQPTTAMLANLKDVKQWLQQALVDVAPNLPAVLHHTTPHTVPWAHLLAALAPTLQRSMAQHLPEAQLLRLTLDSLTGQQLTYVTPHTEQQPPYSPLRMPTMLILTRRYEFAAAHRLCNPSFDDATNWAVFYDCNNPHGHGHNYELEVLLAGEPDPNTGMIINLLDLDELVNTHLLRPLDHKHLNHDVPFLAGCITTAESVAMACYHQLAPQLPQDVTLYGVRLHESHNNAAEYYGQPLPQHQAVLPLAISRN